jgi:hypothetical protein
MKPTLVFTLGLLVLGGCQSVASETVLPGIENTTPEILLGHVPGGLPADFYDRARDATSDSVRAYISLSDEITASGGMGSERLRPLVAPDWWPSEQQGFAYFGDQGLRTLGTSAVSRLLVQSARLTAQDTIEVGVIACVDTTGVLILPADSADPPESLWEWHPHYEDFQGEPAQWAQIEAFLDSPDVSWGSPEAVVFWFKGPTTGSLLLTSSQPWWGVYSCV